MNSLGCWFGASYSHLKPWRQVQETIAIPIHDIQTPRDTVFHVVPHSRANGFKSAATAALGLALAIRSRELSLGRSFLLSCRQFRIARAVSTRTVRAKLQACIGVRKVAASVSKP